MHMDSNIWGGGFEEYWKTLGVKISVGEQGYKDNIFMEKLIRSFKGNAHI